MENNIQLKIEKKIGEDGYINKNCWLATTVNGAPSKRCQYCRSKFSDCLFFRYLTISFILIVFLLSASLIMEGTISKLTVIAIFLLVIIYGYFFDKSTEKIIEANFAQSKAKDALEELTQNLQQKIDDQTRELRKSYEMEKKANEQLEALDNVKNQFLMTVQHHLRTPLTSMMGYADLLLSGTFGKVSKEVSEIIKKFEESTEGLIKMVNDFLDVTQFQMGKGVVCMQEGVNLCPIFKDLLSDLELEAKQKGIYLKLEKPEHTCLIKADINKLKAAFTNIFDNAVKYTQKGGVTIRFKVENKKLHVQIQDTGIGIAKDRLAHLFDNTFTRTEESKKTFTTGRGIGLYLSAQIIKAHEGEVWAESEGEGKGSTFNIVLPIEPDQK
jgi:signal transduction histidine kinase